MRTGAWHWQIGSSGYQYYEWKCSNPDCNGTVVGNKTSFLCRCARTRSRVHNYKGSESRNEHPGWCLGELPGSSCLSPGVFGTLESDEFRSIHHYPRAWWWQHQLGSKQNFPSKSHARTLWHPRVFHFPESTHKNIQLFFLAKRIVADVSLYIARLQDYLLPPRHG